MTVKYLTDIKEFLERNVAPKISLRGIADKDDTTCLMSARMLPLDCLSPLILRLASEIRFRGS